MKKKRKKKAKLEEQFTEGCGCVFCDLNVEHPEGVKCTNEQKRV